MFGRSSCALLRFHAQRFVHSDNHLSSRFSGKSVKKSMMSLNLLALSACPASSCGGGQSVSEEGREDDMRRRQLYPGVSLQQKRRCDDIGRMQAAGARDRHRRWQARHDSSGTNTFCRWRRRYPRTCRERRICIDPGHQIMEA
jgi:hypothetical protein